MTALANERMSMLEAWKYKQFTLASGHKAFKNGMACIAIGTGKVVQGAASTSLFVIGKFAETVDATAGDKLVNVQLAREIWVEWFANDSSSVAATDLGGICYVKDDQSVTITPTGASTAGRVWGVDSAKGVAVEFLSAVPSPIVSLDGLLLNEVTPPAFSSNNINIANSPDSGSVYDCPTTGAASTITLPATANEGTVLYFTADGTHNGHTVQYRDATGPTNITTALTASKRHLVIAMFVGGAWRANAYVSP
jgi:hypothetical protein